MADYGIYFLVTMYLCIGMGALILFAGPAFIWGVKFTFKKMTLKQNLGLLFLKNKADNLGFPELVDLRLDKHQIKNKEGTKSWVIDSNSFKGGTFLGQKFAIFDMDDSLTSLGLYYQQNELKEIKDEDGNVTGSKLLPVETYYAIKNDDGETIDTGIPKLSPMKPSNKVDPKLMFNVAVNEKIESLIRQLKTNKNLMYLLFGCVAAAGIGAYFSYEMFSNQLPIVIDKLDTIIELIKGGTQ